MVRWGELNESTEHSMKSTRMSNNNSNVCKHSVLTTLFAINYDSNYKVFLLPLRLLTHSSPWLIVSWPTFIFSSKCTRKSLLWNKTECRRCCPHAVTTCYTLYAKQQSHALCLSKYRVIRFDAFLSIFLSLSLSYVYMFILTLTDL